MAIKLQSLYEAINNQFDVILHTNSFYDKEVTWIHTVQQVNSPICSTVMN